LPRETTRDRLKRLLTGLRGRLAKRGISLSLLFLLSLLEEGRRARASEVLCRRLDAALPGRPCQQITAAGAVALPPAAWLADAGLAPLVSAKLALSVAVVLLACAAGGTVWYTATPRGPALSPAYSRTLEPADAPTGRAAGPASARPTTTETSTAKALPQEPVEEGAPGGALAGPAGKKPGPAGNRLRLEDLPPAVRAAAETAVPGWVLTRAEKEEKAGQVAYELEGRAGGKFFELEVGPDGTVRKLHEKTPQEVQEDEQEENEKKAKAPPAPAGASDPGVPF
jgi:hypothetical protein